MIINRKEVRDMDLSSVYKHKPENKDLAQGAGIEPFHLLSYLSTKFNGKRLLDLGSREGNSALALSYNQSCFVDSFDINANYYAYCKARFGHLSNVNFYFENIIDDNNLHRLLDYPLINLDVDPHDGLQELKVHHFLVENNYNGIVVWDDIGKEWPAMQKLWYSINIEKHNVTDIGHWSGTGIVDYSGDLVIE